MQRDISFTIGELAKAHDISLRSLRFYDEIGLLTPVRIGYARYYGAREELRLKVILRAKRMGFTLAEIERIMGPEAAEPAVVLTVDRIRKQIDTLEQRRGTIVAAIDELCTALAAKAP